MKKTAYICTLPACDRFRIYKAIKRYLLTIGMYDYTEMLLALSGRVSDVEYVQGVL